MTRSRMRLVDAAQQRAGTEGDPPETATFRPLYRQIKELLLSRVASGEWPPGTFLPSEFALAATYGISQGTVRKALDELAAENIVVRYQGKGTAVTVHSSDRSLFRFFHLVRNDGVRELPSSIVHTLVEASASSEEAEALAIAPGDPIVRIGRVRMLDGRPIMNESIALPASRFKGFLDPHDQLPNTLYDLYQRRFGITVSKTIEKLAAVAADADDADRLRVKAGVPLLEIRRVALDVSQLPVEYRVSRCLTRDHSYVVEPN
jgi:GntR family transcriptional regulator